MNKYTFLFGGVLCQNVYCGCCGDGGSKNSSKSKISKKSSNQKPGAQKPENSGLGTGGANPIKTTSLTDTGVVDPNAVHGLERLPYYENAIDWTNLCAPGGELADCSDIFKKYPDFIIQLMCFIKDGTPIDPSNKAARENENKAKFSKACETVKVLTSDAHWRPDKKDSSALEPYFVDFDIEHDHTLTIYRDETNFYLWYGSNEDFDNNVSGIKDSLKKSVPIYGAYGLNNNNKLCRVSTDCFIYDASGNRDKEQLKLD